MSTRAPILFRLSNVRVNVKRLYPVILIAKKTFTCSIVYYTFSKRFIIHYTLN